MSKKSIVWNYFVQKNDYASCKICNKELRCVGGSTSGLLSHMNTQHKDAVNSSSSTNQNKITNYLIKNSLSREIAELAAKDGFTFNQISKSRLIQNILRQRHQQIVPKTAKGVSRHVKLFHKNQIKIQKKKFQEDLKKNIRFSITLDEYTSIQNKKFLNIKNKN